MTIPEQMIILMIAFQIKHLVMDWWLQPPWMYKNKGTFGHPGGLVHAGWQALVSIPLLLKLTPASFNLILMLALLEFVAHYTMDLVKMNLNRKMSWGPTTSENFWRLTGFDQFIHQFTYVVMIAVIYT